MVCFDSVVGVCFGFVAAEVCFGFDFLPYFGYLLCSTGFAVVEAFEHFAVTIVGAFVILLCFGFDCFPYFGFDFVVEACFVVKVCLIIIEVFEIGLGYSSRIFVGHLSI